MESLIRYDAEVAGGVHGVSCIFPTLKSIIDYEENSYVPNQGYPRFIAHPYVVAVQNKHKQTDKEVIAVQNPEAAYLVHLNYFDTDTREHSCIESRDEKGNTYGLIYVDKEYAHSAKNTITNAGVILSSRKAERIINGIKPPNRSETLISKLSRLEKGSNPELTFDYTSGMAAIFDAVISLLPIKKSIAVIGNVYVDSKKIFTNLPERFNYSKTQFFQNCNDLVCDNSTKIVFLEIPSNPLLQLEDLALVVKKAHAIGALVIVDSTIATPYHFSPFEFGADIIIHSTTKSLSGKNNHMGGVLFVNPATPLLAEKLNHNAFRLDEDEGLVLERNLSNFHERIKQMNHNAQMVLNYLKKEQNVGRVYYADGLKNGNGHVISFELKEDSLRFAEAFYDNCTLPTKGPSMGYEKSMMMPYTLITHYGYSDEYLAKIGLKKYLMRFSVGTESADEIIGHLSNGLIALAQLKFNN